MTKMLRLNQLISVQTSGFVCRGDLSLIQIENCSNFCRELRARESKIKEAIALYKPCWTIDLFSFVKL